jgi:hypothetical protein
MVSEVSVHCYGLTLRQKEYHRRRTGWRIAAELIGAQKTKEKEKGRGQGQNIPFQDMSL